MINILEMILNILYPNVCGFCGRLDNNSLCEKCENDLEDKLVYEIIDTNNKYFDELISVAYYKDEFRDKILQFKFEDKPYMYKTFSKLILKNKKICGIIRKL